ncbi:MAG: HlyD family efflux transporter periplasmic adaptor subunit, partial [Planctomycetota bacterium]
AGDADAGLRAITLEKTKHWNSGFHDSTCVEKTRLKSPFDAVVSRRHLDTGRVVEPGVPVLRLLERDRPQARIGVAGKSVSGIANGQSVVIRIGEGEVPGTVTSILPTRDQRGRAIDVIIELDARLDGLRHGDLARLAITRSVDSRGFWVPMQALTEGTRGLWSLYTLERAGSSADEVHILRAEVELLHSVEDRAYVCGALPEDVRFVTRGLQRIAPGMAVRDQSTLLGLAPSDRSMP